MRYVRRTETSMTPHPRGLISYPGVSHGQCSQRARPGYSGNVLGRYRPNSTGLRKPIRPDRRLWPGN